MRATSMNRRAGQFMGVNVRRVSLVAWGTVVQRRSQRLRLARSGRLAAAPTVAVLDHEQRDLPRAIRRRHAGRNRDPAESPNMMRMSTSPSDRVWSAKGSHSRINCAGCGVVCRNPSYHTGSLHDRLLPGAPHSGRRLSSDKTY
jgi:hypothetical protein